MTHDDLIDDEETEQDFCYACQNYGYVECRCGGDLCFCANGGEKPCDKCDRGTYQ